MNTENVQTESSRVARIDIGRPESLEGNLNIPRGASGVVVFAHGSGSSRFSPRNQFVAKTLRATGLGTFLFDLLTREEEAVDEQTGEFRFNIPLLADRLIHAGQWLRRQPEIRDLKIGYFGSSTGGGAALVAAAKEPELAAAIVSRGGRPDLAGSALTTVKAPTLLIVGENDRPVIKMNQDAMGKMSQAEVKLEIIPGATHLFSEPGTLEQVAALAGQWFKRHLSSGA